jgi:hypothetical protein
MLKFKDIGSDVVTLQELLCKNGYTVSITGLFDDETDREVRKFQRDHQLGVDGIVGNKTWTCLQETTQPRQSVKLTENDYVRAAGQLNIEVAALKAVKEVETGGRGGFLSDGKPTILFEGHIFWSQLTKVGLNPENYVKGNEDILYPKWTKEHYKGGLDEYKRLAKALKIHEKSAVCSASWGLFQIMGFNYPACQCENARDFVEKMCYNEGSQLDLFVAFLRKNGWDKYLRSLDWAGFAKHYNGPSYAQNKYDEKLQKAYLKNRH